MGTEFGEPSEVDRLYQCSNRLSEAEDKAEVVGEFELIMKTVKGGSTKAKQLAAQLLPKFLKHFPALGNDAMNTIFDLVEDEELAVRVQAIRGLSLLCKDIPNYVSKIVDVLVQLLTCVENVERDVVHKTLMSLLRQDVKATFTALFKQVENDDENIRDKVICFLKDGVFPLKSELLKPQVEMERHVTALVKSLQDLTGVEFKLFVDFLKNFSIFGSSSPPEQVQELIQIIEGQAYLDARFDVSDIDHIDRLITCFYMALPFFKKGVSSSKILNYMNAHLIPAFDEFPEERKLDLLKNLAGSSPYATTQDSRQLLPSIVQLLKKYMPGAETEEANIDFVECLLFTFHHLSHKTPNSTNSLCGYKIVTGQPSDRLGEDFSENYKDFTERLNATEEIVRDAMEKLTQGIGESNKAFVAAKTEEEKANIGKEQQKLLRLLKMCRNILAMTEPLHSNVPSFIGGEDDTISLSWYPVKPLPGPAAAGDKRDAPPGAYTPFPKRGRGEVPTYRDKRDAPPGAYTPFPKRGRGEGGRGFAGGGQWRGRGRGRGNRGRGRGF